MRRAGSYSPRTEESGGEQGFWPSYADMMSAVALILFFLMLLSYIQNLITGNNLRNTEDLLATTKAQVQEALEEYRKARADLALMMEQYNLAQEDLQNLTDDLNRKQDELELYAIQINRQTDAIRDQQKLIEDQKAYLAAANNEIVTLRSQMTTVAALRLSVLKQITDSLVEIIGDASKVSIGDNGNIILSEGVFFDLGSSNLKPESVTVLNGLIDAFSAFLSDPNTTQYLDSIVIAGHTDSTGTDEDNRLLSTDRANSVLNYLLAGQGGALADYASYFCAAGYGETRPVADNSTFWGQARNRRIEISMIIRDESVLDIVEQYLAIDVPNAPTSDEVDRSLASVPAVTPSPAPLPTPTPAPSPVGFTFFGRG